MPNEPVYKYAINCTLDLGTSFSSVGEFVEYFNKTYENFFGGYTKLSVRSGEFQLGTITKQGNFGLSADDIFKIKKIINGKLAEGPIAKYKIRVESIVLIN